jgi:hypothetical protein
MPFSAISDTRLTSFTITWFPFKYIEFVFKVLCKAYNYTFYAQL